MTDSTRDRLLDVHPGDRWLVAVAHPDDESFGCGSTIAHAAALGAEVTVVCATRGEAGEPTPGSPSGDELGAVREEELRPTAARLGVSRVELSATPTPASTATLRPVRCARPPCPRSPTPWVAGSGNFAPRCS
jgi:LmbE family N-acetylglucosaminyl deacetylase